MLTGGLVLAFMAWRVHNAPALRRVPGGRVWAPALLVMAAVALLVWPAGLTIGALDLAPLAWLLIFLAAILLPPPSPVVQGTLIWLAVTFIGYNFLLADPRTHIYGIFLPWSLLAGAAVAALWNAWKPARWRWAAIALAGAVCLVLMPVPVRHLPAARWRTQPGSARARARVGMGAGTLRWATDRQYFRHGASLELEGHRRALCRGQACGGLRQQRET